MSLNNLKDPKWLIKNEFALKHIFPAIWTHSDNLNFLKIRFQLKIVGIDFKNDEELSHVLAILTRLGIIEYKKLTNDKLQIRRGAESLKQVVAS